jgi:hypothetical protein
MVQCLDARLRQLARSRPILASVKLEQLPYLLQRIPLSRAGVSMSPLRW